MFSGKFADAPIFAHFGLDKVLVDSSEFDGKSLVQAFDNLIITFHEKILIQE
jgi:hypothetical protein